jgi:hypothetical protein
MSASVTAAGVFPRSADWRRAACRIHRLYLGQSSIARLPADGGEGNPEVKLLTCGRALSAKMAPGAVHSLTGNFPATAWKGAKSP